jgi:thiol-disulfide isomerase/thioredoxin
MKQWILTQAKKLAHPRAIISAAIYMALFISLIWWQHRDMLSTGEMIHVSELKLLDINGQVFSHALNNTKDDTLIYFFAPWCHICHASIDNIETIQTSNPASLKIIVIALDWQSVEEVDAFLAEHQLTVPVLLGTREIQQRFKVTAFPSYYLIDKSGAVVARNKGYSTEWGMKLSLALNR